MGQFLQKSGLGESLFSALYILVGRIKGGLAVGVIILCSLIGCMVGIIGAGIIISGTVALGPMLKRGYDKYLAMGAIMAGGGMGILIPPSIPMILFCSVTASSLGRLFAGAIFPALIMITCFVIYIVVRCAINPAMGPPVPREELAMRPYAKLLALRDAGSSMGLIFMVLGAILLGMATPTEAAAFGGLGALLVAILYGRFNLSVLKSSSKAALLLTSMVLWILIGASVFSNFHMMMGAHKLLTRVTQEAGLSPWTIIILMQLSMLLLGSFVDEYVVVLICAPFFTPVAVGLGFDPIWFGVLMILNLEIVIQTPPYGFALFYLKAIVPPDITMVDIYKSIAPFVTIKLFVLVLCMVFPEIVTWLPNRLFN